MLSNSSTIKLHCTPSSQTTGAGCLYKWMQSSNFLSVALRKYWEIRCQSPVILLEHYFTPGMLGDLAVLPCQVNSRGIYYKMCWSFKYLCVCSYQSAWTQRYVNDCLKKTKLDIRTSNYSAVCYIRYIIVYHEFYKIFLSISIGVLLYILKILSRNI
jgi:hypothetical protein